MNQRDGQKKAYLLVDVTTEFTLDVSDRKKRITLDLSCDARDLKPVVK
jgi:hypothetical protein